MIHLIAGFLFIIVIYKILDYLVRIPSVSAIEKKYIFITGCDTGFGFECARQLDKLGCHVIAGCLTDKGEGDVRKGCSERLMSVHMDVTDKDSVRKAFSYVESILPKGTGLWGLINNAGVGLHAGMTDWLPVDAYRPTMEVNFFGLVEVTSVFLPLVKRARGRIVNTASAAGRVSPSFVAPYAASKFAVVAFNDSLRRTLRNVGCSIHLIEPGFHKTNITSARFMERAYRNGWGMASQEVKAEYGEAYFDEFLRMHASGEVIDKFAADPQGVVDAYIHALLSRFPRTRYVVGLDARTVWTWIYYAPEWLADFISHRILKTPEEMKTSYKKHRY